MGVSLSPVHLCISYDSHDEIARYQSMKETTNSACSINQTQLDGVGLEHRIVTVEAHSVTRAKPAK